jgi:hypothetical protein
VQDEQDRRAREIAVLAQHFPGNARVTFGQAELLFDIREQLLPSGMQQECGDVAPIEAMASQEAVDEAGNLLADQLGNVLREDDVESGVTEIETHRVQRLRKRIGLGVQDVRAVLAAARYERRSGTIAEEHARDEIRLRRVVALERQRGKLDRDDERRLVRKCADELPGTRERHGARGAPKLGHGKPPDIGTESHQVDEVCVERRDHESGARDRDDHVHVARAQAGAPQRGVRGFATETNRVLLILDRGLRQGTAFDEVLDGKDRMPLIDAGVVDHRHHRVEAPPFEPENAPHVKLHAVARERVGRKSRRGSRDGSHRGGPSGCAAVRPSARTRRVVHQRTGQRTQNGVRAVSREDRRKGRPSVSLDYRRFHNS